MPSMTHEKHELIHTLLCEASNIFAQMLEDQLQPNRDLIEGMEKVLYAADLAGHWDKKTSLCPSCGCVYSRPMSNDRAQCLSCDCEWETS